MRFSRLVAAWAAVAAKDVLAGMPPKELARMTGVTLLGYVVLRLAGALFTAWVESPSPSRPDGWAR